MRADKNDFDQCLPVCPFVVPARIPAPPACMSRVSDHLHASLEEPKRRWNWKNREVRIVYTVGTCDVVRCCRVSRKVGVYGVDELLSVETDVQFSA